MRAEFDSRADALQILLDASDRWSHGVDLDGVHVDFGPDDVPLGLELLQPTGDLEALTAVAGRLGLDGQALVAAARAALAAPDRRVTLTVEMRQVA